MPKKVLIITGEASGDYNGANLAKAIYKELPSVDIFAIGGSNLKEANVNVLYDFSILGVIGIWEAVKIIPRLLKVFNIVKEAILRLSPDLIIFIDSAAVNMRLAEFSRKKGFKSIYYFPPSAWGRNYKKIKSVGKAVDHVIAVFEHTAETYRFAGIDTSYFGHPIADSINFSHSRYDIEKELELPANRRLVGLFPGSRRQEIKNHLEIMIKSARKIQDIIPDVFFLIPAASDEIYDMILDRLKGEDLPLKVIKKNSQKILQISELAVASSGSVTLEAVCAQTPVIIIYRLCFFDYIMSRLLIKGVPFAGLPNLISGRMIAPEFLHEEANVKNITDSALKILKNEELKEKMKKELGEAKDRLGSKGVLKKIALKVAEYLK